MQRGRTGRSRRAPRVGATVAVVSPLTIFLSTGVYLWVRADLGMTGGANMTAWADQSGNARSFTPYATGPAITVADATLNNLQTLGFGDVQGIKTAALALATPFYYLAVVKPLTWNNTILVIGDPENANRGQVAYAGGSPNMFQNNGGFTNGAASTIGTWQRIRASFTNTVADLLKIGSGAATTGGNAGASSPARLGMNANGNAPDHGTFQVYEWVVLPGTPSAGELAAYDAYITAKTAGAAQV